MDIGALLIDDDLEKAQEIARLWNYENERQIARLTNWEKNGLHINANYRFAYKHRRNHLIQIPLECKLKVQFTFYVDGDRERLAWTIEPQDTRYLSLDKWQGKDARGSRPVIR